MERIRYRDWGPELFSLCQRDHHYFELMLKSRGQNITDTIGHKWVNESRFYKNLDSVRPLLDTAEIEFDVYVPADHRSRDNYKSNCEYAVIAFYGSDDYTDVRTDLNAVSPGVDIYFRNEAALQNIVKRLRRKYENVALCGYSLGGCYAQYLGIRNLNRVISIVTFQSLRIHRYFHAITDSEGYNFLNSNKMIQITNINSFSRLVQHG
jgi:hypothetical protein